MGLLCWLWPASLPPLPFAFQMPIAVGDHQRLEACFIDIRCIKLLIKSFPLRPIRPHGLTADAGRTAALPLRPSGRLWTLHQLIASPGSKGEQRDLLTLRAGASQDTVALRNPTAKRVQEKADSQLKRRSADCELCEGSDVDCGAGRHRWMAQTDSRADMHESVGWH